MTGEELEEKWRELDWFSAHFGDVALTTAARVMQHDYPDALKEIERLRTAINDMAVAIALSYQEQANLEIKDWSPEHLRVTLLSIDARLKGCREAIA